MTCYYSLSKLKEYTKTAIERRQEIADIIKSINRKIEIERTILDTNRELYDRDRNCAERYICRLENELVKWTRILSEL